MGIGNVEARNLIAALKLATASKQALRKQLGDAINILQIKVAAMDVQMAEAEKSFAASKQAQFNAHVDALPDVGDTVDPVV